MTWETKVPRGGAPGMRDRARQGPNLVGSTWSNEGRVIESREQEGPLVEVLGLVGGALGRQGAPTVPT